jgi:release factor glutamine methyltransferase
VLSRLGFETAALDAKLLTSHALGLDALALALREQDVVSDDDAARVVDLLQRRMSGESVARIIGTREFYGLPFRLSAATLEPRPDTELLVDLAIKALPEGGRLLDLGTGTGCIPIAILVNRPDASGLATDLSPDALAMARDNTERNGVADRLRFAQGDWFEALEPAADAIELLPPGGGGWVGGRHAHPDSSVPHPNPPREGEGAETATHSSLPPSSGGGRVGVSATKFDLITSNPPYITSAVVETLAPEVKDFDPRLALDGGPDGLAPYRVIAAQSGRFLKPGGHVLVEIGYDQGQAVAALFADEGFADIAVHKDLNGLDRVVGAHHLNDK